MQAGAATRRGRGVCVPPEPPPSPPPPPHPVFQLPRFNHVLAFDPPWACGDSGETHLSCPRTGTPMAALPERGNAQAHSARSQAMPLPAGLALPRASVPRLPPPPRSPGHSMPHWMFTHAPSNLGTHGGPWHMSGTQLKCFVQRVTERWYWVPCSESGQALQVQPSPLHWALATCQLLNWAGS